MDKGDLFVEQFLVFDIGGTFIKYALMGADGSTACRGQVPSPTDGLDSLLVALQGVAQRVGTGAGVAVSMPGRIDTQNGIAHTGGAFRYIRDVPFAARLRAALGVPVTIANDGKCAANAELASGALTGVENGCVVVLGTGTGGGIVLGGRVWMGTTFAAGELSLLPTDFANLYKGIHSAAGGSLDCLWCSAMSATGLLRFYAQRKGLPEDGHGLDGFAFFRAYDAGEPEAAAALQDFGRRAAAGIYAVQAVLDLERYAIGGGISARPEVTEAVRAGVEEVYAAVGITPFGKPEVVRCRYGNDANLLGALHFHLAAR